MYQSYCYFDGLTETCQEQTTPSSPRPEGWVLITHPHHPWHGQQVEVVRIRNGPDPDLIVRLPSGRHVAIAMWYTDYAGAPDVDASAAAPALLDISGLRQIVKLLDHRPGTCGGRAADEPRQISQTGADGYA